MSGRNSQMIGVSNITNRTDPNSLKSRVFVGNLNTVHMTKTELEGIFSKYGAIIGISVHKGYAFIQYGNEASARAAVAGEDAKIYYSMALDVTIASEPKNRKRGRSNVNATIAAWPGFSSSGIPDLTLQAQALSNLASNPMLSSLQQLGLEGIMGQPNFSQFAAAATSVLGGAAPLTGYTFGATQPVASNTRPKHTRSSTSQPSFNPVSTLTTSSSAKRTRLENQNTFGHGSSNLTLPAGARGQNLVSLVSPSDSGTSNQANKTPASVNRHSDTGTSGSEQSKSSTGRVRDSTPTNLPASSKRSVESNSFVSVTSRTQSEDSGRSAAEDILICGTCRRLFDQVDELISHKMAGCSLYQGTCHSCRCRSGEPELLECAYCGATFNWAWDLMHHCHNDHGLTIYTIPSPSSSPSVSRKNSTTLSASDLKKSNGSRKITLSPNNNSEHNEANTTHSDTHKLESQDDNHDDSDWERDPDEYALESGNPAHQEEIEHSSPHPGSRSPSSSPTHSTEADVKPGDSKEQSPSDIKPAKEITNSNDEHLGHRRRGGEYGRHETMADEEDDVIDDDETSERDSARDN